MANNDVHDTQDIHTINSLAFEQEVLQASETVLVDFTAKWCAPCRAAEPVLQRMAREQAGQLKVVKIDAEDSPDLVAELGIRGFPTFVVYRSGREVRRSAGFHSAAKLEALAR